MSQKFYTQWKKPDDKTGKHFYKPSLTDQSFAYDADINNIVNGIGIVPQVAQQPPQFGQEFNPDFFQNALNVVANAKSEFEKLPAIVRKEFNNDINQFVEFIDNPDEANAKKGVKLGIFKPEIIEKFKPVQDIVKPTANVENEAVNGISPA